MLTQGDSISTPNKLDHVRSCALREENIDHSLRINSD
jgi:hypothetical protein